MIKDITSLSFTSPRGFIVLEGVNGAGKSTLLERLKTYAESRGLKVTSTREPGATRLGKELRAILLENKAGNVAPLSELLLFAADRHQHVEEVIRPALTKHEIVICDRFLYSTMAFQGYGRGLDKATIDDLNSRAVGGTLPDLVLLLNLDAEEGLRRTKGRSERVGTKDTFEAEELAFHHALQKGFLEIAANRPEPFVILDASLPAEEVFRIAQSAVAKLLDQLPSHFTSPR